ncbi:phospholipid scramblase-related protein [Flavobacterium antarcticum]|uniref:phospholipid scramblase-related protein n=1 Tax=Flavobacterium antarcticum TaxID=271155 RepID=UPI0003B7A55D|nr:phospholipid scramblase-related protein [Flavobacterium antarcticum]
MHPILNKNLFLVKEHVGYFKAANNFDIYDAETNELIIKTRENKLGFVTKLLRFTDYKRMTSFHIEVTTISGEKVISIKRGFTVFRSDVEIFDEKDRMIGVFKQKFFSFGGRFNIQDNEGRDLCTLQGKWTGWNFSFKKGTTELAHVSKKWAGIGKEFFTSADNYVLQIHNDVPQNDAVRPLILAAVMCIDMVFKE